MEFKTSGYAGTTFAMTFGGADGSAPPVASVWSGASGASYAAVWHYGDVEDVPLTDFSFDGPEEKRPNALFPNGWFRKGQAMFLTSVAGSGKSVITTQLCYGWSDKDIAEAESRVRMPNPKGKMGKEFIAYLRRVLMPTIEPGVYELSAVKRGNRLGWTNPPGKNYLFPLLRYSSE